jgi:heptosyltransferase I
MIHILAVRLGAMGDVIHTLPAASRLKRIPGARLTWIIDPKWLPLITEVADETIAFDRTNWGSMRAAWRGLRTHTFDIAVDFQGLIKSALVARAARPARLIGYAKPRESAAVLFYSEKVRPEQRHIIDQHLALAAAAGATAGPVEFPLPPGRPEGELPGGDFVLASPLAGWRSKQWPLEYYAQLAGRGVPLVLNGPPAAKAELEQVKGARVHLSGIEGLIHATRRAVAVIGVDSGPLHLAAALNKRGVAIFGPTDPERNGPYGGAMRVLRDPAAHTTYKRGRKISAEMRAITPQQVIEALP